MYPSSRFASGANDHSDWNPQQDIQAQDRCHRIGQTRPVIIYRLATRNSVEDTLLQRAEGKRRLERIVIKDGRQQTLGQGSDMNEDLAVETLRARLARDLEVCDLSDKNNILSDADLDALCDRYGALPLRILSPPN